MFHSHAGAAGQAKLLPASVTLVATPQGSTGTFNGISIGAYHPKRTIILAAGIRSDTGGTVVATLDTNSMTNRISQNTGGGANPTGLLTIFAGAGSPFEDEITADLVISGPGTILRTANGIFRALNLNSDVPTDMDSTTSLLGSMNINKKVDGIVIAAGYRFTEATYAWSNITNDQTVSVPTLGPSNALGWDENNADVTGAAIGTTPAEPITNQASSVSALWHGESNP